MTIFREANIKDAWIIDPVRHNDDRGWFQELLKQSVIKDQTGITFAPTQINVSHSSQGVIRGIHYSIAPEGQAKYVTVMDGEIDDYIIDIRPKSPTFGTWQKVRLNSEIGNSVLLGHHLAHAFQVISNHATVCYAVSAEFNPSAEMALTPLCPTLSINWANDMPFKMSEKDTAAPTLSEQVLRNCLPDQ